jgi:probable F420-dependent oxidoreductase
MLLRQALSMPNFGDYGEARTAIRLAQAAERAGWDGLFIWDHLAFTWGTPSGDPWVILSAIAASTERLRLGTAVTPIARRRLQVLANQVATLDRLAGGRVILGVGLGGVPREFAAFGEPDDAAARAVRLDEGLVVLNDLLSGKEVSHHGLYLDIDGVTLAPLPQSRIPIWVGGTSRRALRRAAQWDGWMADSASETEITVSPERLASDIAYIREHRDGEEPFEVTFSGYSQLSDRELVRSYAEAGATWWIESIHGIRGSLDEMLARVEAGPVQL